jgi:predicted phosphodiesterase
VPEERTEEVLMTGSERVVSANGPVLVFGGPYGNLEATRALLTEARRLAIPPDHIICTGDIVAYCADPVATLDLVQDSGIHVVMGNCDEQLGTNADDCGCGFPEGSSCDRLSAAWYAYADARVTPTHRRWLAALPRRVVLKIGGLRLAVVHGTSSEISRFVFASTPALAKKRDLDAVGCDGIVAGHCGLPFTQVIDGRLWHNPGVIGMPAHDGTPRVWYSILTPSSGGIEIAHHALQYDHTAAAAAMRRAGLPSEYEIALASGNWPSCDVLPQAEIHAAGIPLVPGTVVWKPDAKERSTRRGAPIRERDLWPIERRDNRIPLAPEKFKHPGVTAKGEQRARVPLRALETLWFNTGTLCNITCRNCYIESSPKNDRLVYLTLDDVKPYLDEIERDRLPTREIGFTGGEPFMNPHFLAILEECLSRSFSVLVLTNAMRPMQRHKRALLGLKARYGKRLVMRVSLDHFNPDRHEEERGIDTFEPAMAGLSWLSDNGFEIAVAGRSMWRETAQASRGGFSALFASRGIRIDARDPAALVLFPEMDEHLDVPEITTACWDILSKSPDDMMCATSRMVVKRKGEDTPKVVACTLLAYEPQFELGHTLKEASRAVPLNHAHCAKFCVLGGASCSPAAPEPTTSRPTAESPLAAGPASPDLGPMGR